MLEFSRRGSPKKLLYAITNRLHYGAEAVVRRRRLLELAALWAAHGVAFIQLREKDLPAREQVDLARAILNILRPASQRAGAIGHRHSQIGTRLLVNGRPDVARAAGADGVHLPSGPEALTPAQVRAIFAAAGQPAAPAISVSCHTLAEVEAARQQTPDCILFGPVFEKADLPPASPDAAGPRSLPGTGLVLLDQACRLAAPIPVFALGGVTGDNAAQCLTAGAAGVAAIRLLQERPSTWQNLG